MSVDRHLGSILEAGAGCLSTLREADTSPFMISDFLSMFWLWAWTALSLHKVQYASAFFFVFCFIVAQREDRSWQGQHRRCSYKMWPKRSHICSKCTAETGTVSVVSRPFIYLFTLSQTYKAKKSLHLFGLSLQRHIIEQSRQKEHCLDYYYAVRKSIETAFKMWGLANAFVSVLLNRCSYQRYWTG